MPDADVGSPHYSVNAIDNLTPITSACNDSVRSWTTLPDGTLSLLGGFHDVS